MSWTTVSFDGAVLADGIKVTVWARTAWHTCLIAPKALGIACKPMGDGHTATFIIPKPSTKVSVEFDLPAPNDGNRVYNVVPAALLIFADEPEPADVILPELDSPFYYGPGDQDIGCVTVPANQTVYIAGGAYLTRRVQDFVL